MVDKKDLQIAVLEHEIKEVERIYEQEIGKKIGYYYYPKKEKNESKDDRIRKLSIHCVRGLWSKLIEDIITGMKTKIKERAHKTEDFSEIIMELDEIEENLRKNEYDRNELKKIYDDRLRKITTMAKSKIEIEKSRIRDRTKDLIINFLVAAMFFFLGIIFTVFILE